MQGLSRGRCAAAVVAVLTTLVCSAEASAQAPAGLGDQLFSTGGEITVLVLRPTAGLISELQLYNADGTITPIAKNTDVGTTVTLPARPAGEELLFGIAVQDAEKNVYKLGPGTRNPDGLEHGRVLQTGERQYDVGFEDLFNGGDRDYDDNNFRFSGGLAPNRAPWPTTRR